MALIQVPLTDSLNDWRVKTNQISTGLGDFDALSTVAADVVGAVNEIISLNVVFNGDKTFNGSTILGDNAATDTTTINGILTVADNDLIVKDGGLTKFSVDSDTGDTLIEGDVTVNGLTSTFAQNVVILGDLSVSGQFITVDDLNIASPILLLNSEQTGIPDQDAGLRIERGDAPDAYLVFKEDIDRWSLSIDGGLTYKTIVTNGGGGLFTITDGDGTPINIATDESIHIAEGAGIDVNFTDDGSPSYQLTVTNIDRGSSQNIFKNFVVSGQSSIVADNNNDTFTIANNAGIQLLTNATTDTLTINHANTSDAASTNQTNSNGSVVQSINIGLDEFGHVSTLTASSINLDSRYYTETESDARFVNSNGDTMTNTLVVAKTNTLDNNLFSSGNIEARSSGVDVASIGFNRPGNSAIALYHAGYNADALYIRQASGETYKVWHAGSDGSGSTLDADLLDGQEGTFYRNASNINAGTINDAYLPNTITSDITGNAATASKWLTARTITLGGDLTGNVSIDGSANVTLSAQVVDNSHNHVFSNISDGVESVQDIVGAMVSGNTEAGISVVYQDVDGTLDFDVNDFTITIGGVVTGVGTVSNLGNTTITTSFAAGSTVDNANNATNSVNSNNILVDADNSTNANHYIVFSGGPSGQQRLNSDTGLLYNPSSNTLTTTTFAGNLTGNADTASKWLTARTITLGGDLTGSVSINGSANVTLSAQVVNDSHEHDGRYYTETESDGRYLGRAFNTWQTSSEGIQRLFFTYSSHTYIKSASNVYIRTSNNDTDRFTFDTGGNFTASGNVTAFSDERLKKDWIGHSEDFIFKLANVKNGSFTRIDENVRQVGVSAQSLEEVIPEAIINNDDGMKSVAYGNAAMTSVVELAKEIIKLREEIERLKRG